MTDRTFRAALCYNGKHHTSTQNNISQYPLWFKGQEIPVCCHKHEKSMATSVPNSDVLVFYVSYLEPSSRIYFFLASTATEKAHKVNIYRFQL